jgi:hypothetical protein
LATGWSDFWFTIAKAILPEIGLYRLARWIAERHYAGSGSFHRTGTKELVLARISGRAKDLNAADGYYRDAVTCGPMNRTHTFCGALSVSETVK